MSASDVESIVRDLVDMSIKMTSRAGNDAKRCDFRAEEAAEERVLDLLVAQAAKRLR